MIVLNNRSIRDTSGTLSDLSVSLAGFTDSAVSFQFLSTEYLYLGSRLPFNHRFFDLGTANVNSSTVSIELWNGKEWVSAVNVLDQTNGFTESGIISWELDRQENWLRENTDDMDASGLETLIIYDLFWARLSVDSDLSAGTTLSFIGWKYAEDEDFAVFYPDLNTTRVKQQFESGKTTWDEQHFQAAETIVRDLESLKNQEFYNGNQIIRWEVLKEASIHKVAEMIYRSHGKDSKDLRADANAEYLKAINVQNLLADVNQNTRLDTFEEIPSFEVRRR